MSTKPDQAQLIDAGAHSRSSDWILEGIALLEGVRGAVPEESLGHLLYNLGNGHLALHGVRAGRSLSSRNTQALASAVCALAQAIDLKPSLVEARVNLANALLSQGRAIEAIDQLTATIVLAPGHPMARLRRAAALEHAHSWLHPRKGLLDSALADAEAALERAAPHPEYRQACEATVSKLRKRLENSQSHSGARVQRDRITSWLWDSGLALNPCVLCSEVSPTAFDVIALDGVLDSRRRRPTADEVGEIVSAWHRTYSSARWTLLSALEVAQPLPKDHVVTLGKEVTGHTDLKTGLLLLSIVGFHSLFDQIAFGLNSYLHLKHSPARVNFSNMWLRPGQRPRQHAVLNPDELHPSLSTKPLPPLTALYWLSRSLQDDTGLNRRLRELRNKAEHHVTLPVKAATSSRYLASVDRERLEEDALALGRLAKAAIWYAGGTIFAHERRRAQSAAKRGAMITEGQRWTVRR